MASGGGTSFSSSGFLAPGAGAATFNLCTWLSILLISAGNKKIKKLPTRYWQEWYSHAFTTWKLFHYKGRAFWISTRDNTSWKCIPRCVQQWHIERLRSRRLHQPEMPRTYECRVECDATQTRGIFQKWWRNDLSEWKYLLLKHSPGIRHSRIMYMRCIIASLEDSLKRMGQLCLDTSANYSIQR